MFRASNELRADASGGPAPALSGAHIDIVRVIVDAMQNARGVVVPGLGRMAVVPVSGSRPKLIFHGARELNDLLAEESLVQRASGKYPLGKAGAT